MRYKIILQFPELSTAQKCHEMLLKSEVYTGEDIMSISKIKEVCDECAQKQ